MPLVALTARSRQCRAWGPGAPVVCVHHAQVAHGGLTAGDVVILPARRLPGMLRTSRQQLGEADVAAVVAHALAVLRPAG
jgi:hypothetical protein